MAGAVNEEEAAVYYRDIEDIIKVFFTTTFRVQSDTEETQKILVKCKELWELDYKCMVVPNLSGELCNSYPSQLIIPLYELSSESSYSLAHPLRQNISHGGSCDQEKKILPRKHPLKLNLISTNRKSETDCVCSKSTNSQSNGVSCSESNGVNNYKSVHVKGPDELKVISAKEVQSSIVSVLVSDMEQKFSLNSSVELLISDAIEEEGYETEAPEPLQKNGHLSAGKTVTSVEENGNFIEMPLKDCCGVTLAEQIEKAKWGRCRCRFPVPVLFYNDQYLCRSSTISCGTEFYGRLGYKLVTGGSYPSFDSVDHSDTRFSYFWNAFDNIRCQDIRLLRVFNVGRIVDLMVENKKMKYGVYVTSSEKVDKESRYDEFTVVSLPYPGCEFFNDFSKNSYNPENLYFDWNQHFVDAKLLIPESTMSSRVASDWCSYKSWDLIKLTTNYLKLILAYLNEGTSSTLVHCISGWDRTPLFVSLLRLSLWADGLIHPNLSVEQILYLTIGYDWLLFGHDLQDRRYKEEEIFFFCFHFLKYICDDDINNFRNDSIITSDENAGSQRLDTVFHLDAESLHGSTSSLNSWHSSGASAGQPPLIKPDGTDFVTWPCSGVVEEWAEFEDLSPSLSRTSSSSSGRSGGNGARLSGGVRVPSGEGAHSSMPCSREVKVPVHAVEHSRQDASESLFSDTKNDFDNSRRVFQDASPSKKSERASEMEKSKYKASSSPVAVPRGCGGDSVHSEDSCSSFGSWTIVTDAGSFGSSAGYHNLSSSGTSGSSRGSVSSEMVGSRSTIKRKRAESDQSIYVFNRAERLNDVRNIFHRAYVTLAQDSRTESTLANLMNAVAQHLGFF